tara:strand:- start:1281 stop:1814 length:534 start_codon:yes stop_codon:yes gene_type:complete
MSIGNLIRKLPSPIKDTLKDKLYPAMLREGETVPEWTLQSWDGQWYRHKNHKWTVMVFYPGDNTPGCTAQLQDFQKHYGKLKELGAEVFAVNPAEEQSHKEFAEMYGFEFPILTDRGGVVARQFSAAAQFPLKTIIIRTVYLINPQRKIRLANRGAPHAEAIIRSIEALQQAAREGM